MRPVALLLLLLAALSAAAEVRVAFHAASKTIVVDATLADSGEHSVCVCLCVCVCECERKSGEGGRDRSAD